MGFRDLPAELAHATPCPGRSPGQPGRLRDRGRDVRRRGEREPHVGGAAIVGSWRLLRRGGTLVSYGTASRTAAGKVVIVPDA